mmetsp:Transcript_42429/g.88651  ORF Transcript_42429/g.88651 Transcript_42429/m.88651 type:complete len:284 (+) Transcript_42429:280-1131(+)
MATESVLWLASKWNGLASGRAIWTGAGEPITRCASADAWFIRRTSARPAPAVRWHAWAANVRRPHAAAGCGKAPGHADSARLESTVWRRHAWLPRQPYSRTRPGSLPRKSIRRDAWLRLRHGRVWCTEGSFRHRQAQVLERLGDEGARPGRRLAPRDGARQEGQGGRRRRRRLVLLLFLVARQRQAQRGRSAAATDDARAACALRAAIGPRVDAVGGAGLCQVGRRAVQHQARAQQPDRALRARAAHAHPAGALLCAGRAVHGLAPRAQTGAARHLRARPLAL